MSPKRTPAFNAETLEEHLDFMVGVADEQLSHILTLEDLLQSCAEDARICPALKAVINQTLNKKEYKHVKLRITQ